MFKAFKMFAMSGRPRGSRWIDEVDFVAGNSNSQPVHLPVVQDFIVDKVELDLPLLHGGRPDDQLLRQRIQDHERVRKTPWSVLQEELEYHPIFSRNESTLQVIIRYIKLKESNW
jgi:hypothetical protein